MNYINVGKRSQSTFNIVTLISERSKTHANTFISSLNWAQTFIWLWLWTEG